MRRQRHIWAAAECGSLIGRDATPPVSEPGTASTPAGSVTHYVSKVLQ